MTLGRPCDSNFFGHPCRTRASSLVLWERTNPAEEKPSVAGVRKIFQDGSPVTE